VASPPDKKVNNNNTYGQNNRRRSHHFTRYRQIASVLIKYQLKDILKTLGMERFLPLRWLPPGLPWRKTPYTRPERIRMAMEELGTTFIKLGQILSTRTDMIPADFAQELAKLQSSIRPLPVDVVKKVISEELGRPVEEVFTYFDPVAVGVASIGQAHAAVLLDGTEVVVKARKPGVVEQVNEDLEILHQLASSAGQNLQGAEHYDLVGVVEEVGEALKGETDYIREGHHAEHFAKFFAKDRRVHVPKVYWEYTTRQVITLERIRGSNILDIQALDKAGFDRKELAKRTVELWLTMFFENDIFHADPHPGNLFVEADGNLGLIDFGMVGVVDEEVRGYLANAIKAILDREVDRLLDALIELGAVRGDVSKENLRLDLKHIMAHYPKDMDITEIENYSNLGELLAVIRRNHVQMPSNTFLMLKTMAMVQSLGKGLDPEIDIFALLAPRVRHVYRKSHSVTSIVSQLPQAFSDLASLSISLPSRINRLVRSVERGELQVKTDMSGLEVHLEHLERIANRIVLGVVISAIILGVTIVVLAYKLGR
jgi:ubiquinone biosynthesis protein